MEQRIKKDFYASVTVTLGLNGIGDEEVRARIQEAGVHVQRVDLDTISTTRRGGCNAR